LKEEEDDERGYDESWETEKQEDSTKGEETNK
jgi:hypothetical protein